MAHRGQVPDGQPRTLRSNAEQKGTVPAGFIEGVPYSPHAGCPLETVGAATTYQDNADPRNAEPAERRRDQKSPFVVTKRGK